MLTLAAARPLTRGPARLEIAFTHAFNTQAVSLYRMVKHGRGYLFTQMEAEHARQAFPCFDEPAFKFPYQVTLRIPRHQQALFNTPVESEAADGTWKTIRFKKTPPLPSYLLAIAAGPLEFTPIPGLPVPGRVVTVEGQSRMAGMAAACAPPLLHALERYFGRPYPFEKLDLIAVPEYWFGAMENPGAITFADHILLLDPATVTTSQRKNLYRITAHELAHMWFGNLVTMEWWDDLWLNESFADWLGDKITDQVLPEPKHQLDELESGQNIMTIDARPSTEPIRLDAKDGDQAMRNVGLAYNKGKCVLGMFEQWIGPESFRRGVNRYLEAHLWKNAVAGDLWSALGHASGKNVTAALAGFIEQQGYPLVTIETLPDGALRLTQKRYLVHGVEAGPLTWQVPMSIRYHDGASIKTEKFLLNGASATLRLPGARDPVWVMPNGEGLGYYRWNVPRDMLLALVRDGSQAMTSGSPSWATCAPCSRPASWAGTSTCGRWRAWRTAFEHYGFIQSKVPRAFLPRSAFVAGGCSTDRLARARAFFSDPARMVSGLEKRLEQVGDQVQECDGLRRREGAAVGAYLDGLSAGP